MNEKTLVLPSNLKERRKVLEAELKKVAYEIILETLVPTVKELYERAGLPNVQRMDWEFYPESDDEGGTTMHMGGLRAYDEEGQLINLDDYGFQRESYRNDGSTFRVDLYDELIETFWSYKKDLSDYDITELYIN